MVANSTHFFPSSCHDEHNNNPQQHYQYSPTTPQHHSNHRYSRKCRRLLTSTATPIHYEEATTTATSPLAHNAFTNYGLLVTLENDATTNSSTLCLQFCPDRNFHAIHPNAYAPAEMSEVQRLGGGGSGVAVFAGVHPSLGALVMKHGGDKDLSELFALSTVTNELKTRGIGHEAAVRHLQQRTPEFRMIYISPHHLGEKRKTLWKRLREHSRSSNSSFLLPIDELMSSSEGDGSDASGSKARMAFLEEEGEDDNSDDEAADAAEENFQLLKKVSSMQSVVIKANPTAADLPMGVEITESGTVTGHRDIAIMVAAKGTIDECVIKLKGDTLNIILPEGEFQQEKPKDYTGGTSHTACIRFRGDGYHVLKGFVDDLLRLMKNNRWKFTFGQKRIGGTNPKTGNDWLYEARLSGRILDNLVTQKIKLVKDLILLTTEEEQNQSVLEAIREEVRTLETKSVAFRAEDLSEQADAFVGNAIKKNFRSETGRIHVLRMLGQRFREYSQHWSSSFLHIENGDKQRNQYLRQSSGANMILTPEETIPAYHLGCITKPGARLGDIFHKAPLEETILESMGPEYWQAILYQAVKSPNESYRRRSSSMALKRLWTCGLADAGLHNLFLSDDRIWLFDLGEPSLGSAPGFLTKFLFSFFHTLGMQEQSKGPNGSEMCDGWVRRFEPDHKNHKLQLTTETSRLLAQAYSSFEVALNRVVAELFDGDDSIRWLLLQYVTLQIVSDASFCLQKWTLKGGGRARDSNHQAGLEKWLWRALWDIYVACHINSSSSLARFKVMAADPRNKLANAEKATLQRGISLIQELGFETVTPGGSSPEFVGLRRFLNTGS